MAAPIRILLIEDSKSDAQLVEEELRRNDLPVQMERVDTMKGLKDALEDPSWDLIIADYMLPTFRGTKALEVLKERNLTIPLIIVSGSIGEDIAVEAIKSGATDYVMKHNLARLVPAVSRAMEEAQERRARKEAEEAYRTLVEHSLQGLVIIQDDKIQFHNPAAAEILGFDIGELNNLSRAEVLQLLHPEDAEIVRARMSDCLSGRRTPRRYEFRIIRKDGEIRWLELSSNRIEYLGEAAVQATFLDTTARKRMETTLQHRVEQLAALSQASRAVTASLQLDEVLKEIVSLTSEVVTSDYTSVVLLDERGLPKQSAENLSGVPALKYRLREDGITSWILKHKRPVVINSIQPDGTFDTDLEEDGPAVVNPHLVEAQIKAFAGLPLMVKENLLGVIYLHSLTPNSFRGLRPVLTAFANQVAIAIENARLFEEEQQQSQRLSLLAETARIAATTFDAKDLLRSLADAIYSKFEYPLVEIYHRSPGEDKLVRVGLRHSTSPLADRQYRFPMDQGIIGYVARTGRSYLTSDVTDDPYFRPPNTDEMTIRAELCVPILEDGRVIGVIDVESDRQDELGEEDLSMLEAVADTAAIGLRNVRLHRETQRRVKELTLINRLSVGFGAALDLDALINQTLEGLQELMSCERTAFFTIHQEIREWEQTHERLAKDLSPAIQSAYPFELIPVETDTLKAKEPFAVFDVRRDPRVSESQELYEALGMRSFILLPVSIGDELYGALGVGYSRELHAWRSEEIHLLQGVVHQLELALENVHLFEEAQLRAEELAAALARLEELDRLKSEFIQNVSHELRSPLALILGYADLLDSGELGELKPEQEVPISVIARRARMLSNLVRDITVILEAEVNPPEPEPIYLDKLASAVAEDFQLAIEQSDLTLRTEIEPGQPPTKVSPTYMRRVLDNLLSNAVKFTPEGGTITLRVQNEDDHVLLEVQDTGIGIPEEKLDRIFDRFYQVDGSARRRYGGVGLGLALVKEITQAYGGSVTVESQIGHGSTFRLSFPVSEEKRTATSE